MLLTKQFCLLDTFALRKSCSDCEIEKGITNRKKKSKRKRVMEKLIFKMER